MSSNSVGTVDISKYLIPADVTAYEESGYTSQQLSNGLNFLYKEEVWNLRTAWLEKEETLHIRMHTTCKIHVISLKFEQTDAVLNAIKKAGEDFLEMTQSCLFGFAFSPRQEGDFAEREASGKILKTTGGCSQGIRFSPSLTRVSRENRKKKSGLGGNKSIDEMPTLFSKILSTGTHCNMKEAPRVSQEVRSCAENFFKSCPELIPEVEEGVMESNLVDKKV
ncbi:hypothetical protein [Simkania sp.]|uniref:hypothetical protein n=1 Tax=Simkania sp. TaxID=34094 RepID=UPI003B51ACC9